MYLQNGSTVCSVELQHTFTKLQYTVPVLQCAVNSTGQLECTVLVPQQFVLLTCVTAESSCDSSTGTLTHPYFFPAVGEPVHHQQGSGG